MFNLAIIDDEPLARACIIKLIDMSALGISAFVEAKSGIDALKKFKTFTPDIMLVDVRMPGMDGLTLINEVREKVNPSVKPIVVSCYDDFDFSRKAMQLDAYDYILKPVKKDDLVRAIKKAICALEKERHDIQKQQQLNRIVQERIISDFLDKKSANTDDVLDILMCKNHEKLNFLSIVVRINDIPKDHQDNSDCFYKRLQSIVSKISLHQCGIFVVKKAENLYAILFSSLKPLRVNISIITGCLTKELNYLGVDFSIGVGTLKDSYHRLIDSYCEAVKASMEFLISGNNVCYYYDRLSHVRMPTFNCKYSAYEKRVLDCIYIGSNEYYSDLMELFDPSNYSTFVEWKSYFNRFLVSLQKVFYENEINIDLVGELKATINGCKSISDIMQWLHKNIQHLISHITKRSMGTSTENIEVAIEYINAHFSEEISLEFIASLAHMNTTYFCEVFKKYTQKTFLEYLTELRIAKAKELLMNKSLKIYEVSEQVGYKNANYFSGIFKKYTGMGPKKYRRSIK